jgi:PadR family transcriptional regulator, regulatory protein PadR
MKKSSEEGRAELLQGTLDLLILKTLSRGTLHGYGISQDIQRVSEDVLQVEEGSLYPALQRLQIRGWVTSEWRKSPLNRRARYYSLTPAGRRQLEHEETSFEEMVRAITRVLRTV